MLWSDLQLTSDVVQVSQKGIVSLAKDPRISDGKVGHATITVPSHPDLKADLEILFRYNIAFAANFSGAKGTVARTVPTVWMVPAAAWVPPIPIIRPRAATGETAATGPTGRMAVLGRRSGRSGAGSTSARTNPLLQISVSAGGRRNYTWSIPTEAHSQCGPMAEQAVPEAGAAADDPAASGHRAVRTEWMARTGAAAGRVLQGAAVLSTSRMTRRQSRSWA